MNRYIKINLRLFKNAFIRDSQMPWLVFTSILWRVFELIITVIFFNIIFSNVSSLGGWTYWQIIFLYAFARTIIVTHSGWTKRGIKSMANDLIRRGEFDFYLAKPVDSMIMVSISKPVIYNFLTLIFMIPLAIYALIKTGIPIGPENIIWFLITGFVGFILYYFLSVLVIIPSFWLIRLWTISEIIDKMALFMRYPAGIFSEGMKTLLLIVFPIITVSYVPAKMLFSPPEAKYIIFIVIITILFGILTRQLWKMGEKTYTSASS